MSQANLPFITLRMTPNEFHQQVPILLDYARTKGLYDYVVGNDIVKTQGQLNSQNQSKMAIYCTILEAQMVEQETAHAAMVLKRLNTNPLYAYMYNSPITAADPLRPTQLEIDNSREVILYNQESYEEYLVTIRELINQLVAQPEQPNVHPFAHLRSLLASVVSSIRKQQTLPTSFVSESLSTMT